MLSEYRDKDIHLSSREEKRQRSVPFSPEARGSGDYKKRSYEEQTDKGNPERRRCQDSARRGKKRSLEEREFQQERDYVGDCTSERRQHQLSSPEASKPRSSKPRRVYTSSSDSSEFSGSDSSHSSKYMSYKNVHGYSETISHANMINSCTYVLYVPVAHFYFESMHSL